MARGFDTDGKVLTHFGFGNDYAYGVVIEPDGKIVAAGRAYNGTNDDFALACYNPNGSLYADFGTSGKVHSDFGGGWDGAQAIALVPREGVTGGLDSLDLIVAGQVWTDQYDFAAVRYFSPAGGLPVQVPNVAPTLTGADPQTVLVGQPFTITDLGTFTDPGFDKTIAPPTSETFTYEIDWGDGSALDTGTATIDTPGSPGQPTQGSFDGTHTYSEIGIYMIVLTVRDDGGGEVCDFGEIIVNRAPVAVDDPDVQTDESAPVEIQVRANDYDPDPGDWFLIEDVDPMSCLGVITNHETYLTYDPDGAFEYLALGETATETFQYTIADTFGDFASALVTVTVAGVNDAPVAEIDYAVTDEATAVTLDVLENDSDPDATDSRSIQSVQTTGLHGIVTIVDNQLVYDPNGQWEALGLGQSDSETFWYTMEDNHGATAMASVSVLITGVNDNPVAVDDGSPSSRIHITEDQHDPATISVLANDQDPDGYWSWPFVSSVTQASHGEVTFAHKGVIYTPDLNYNGPDQFQYTILDGCGGSSQAWVYLFVDAVEDWPTAAADKAITAETCPVTFDILSNDWDAEGAITLVSVDEFSDSHGTVVNNGNGTVTYSPWVYYQGHGFWGFDSFHYQIQDTAGHTATGTATVYVDSNLWNDPPWAWDDYRSTNEDQSFTFDPTENDWDDGGITLVEVSSPGTATLNPDGTVTYTPPPNFFGLDYYTYVIEDGDGRTASGFVSVTVKSVDDEPVVESDSAFASQAEPVGIYVLDNDSDVELDDLIVTSVGQPSKGTVRFCSHGVTYTANPDATGTDTFTYTAVDGQGAEVSGSVEVTIVTVNTFLLERDTIPLEIPAENWTPVGAQERYFWLHDRLRWAIRASDVSHYNPPEIAGVTWLKKPWDKKDNPLVPWQPFATGGLPGGEDYAIANPGVGDWAITPEVQFAAPDPYVQSSFRARLSTPREMVVAHIVSVAWDGVWLRDGATNLISSRPPDQSEASFYYGRNYPLDGRRATNAPPHKSVQVVVEVQPNVAGIPIRLAFVDADDPTDRDGPIDDDQTDPIEGRFDNRSLPKWPNTSQTFINLTSVLGDPKGDKALVKSNLETCKNPGDNFRVIAGARYRGGEALIKPIFFREPDPGETLGRLYADDDPNGISNQRDAGEAILTETSPVLAADNRFVTTPLLTIWRRLYVEVDSMGQPDPTRSDQYYGFNPNQPIDDPRPGDIADPNIGAFADAFGPAFIQVVNIAELRPKWNQPNLPFTPYLPHPRFPLDPRLPRATWDGYFRVARQSWNPNNPREQWEDDDFWTVYVAGVYEIVPQNDPIRRDNDPDNEVAWLGQTDWQEPEYGMVPMEIIRDVATQWGWNQQQRDAFQRIVALHEIGHQFGLALPEHPPGFGDHVMQIHHSDPEEAQLPNAPTRFSDEDIVTVRNHGTNPKHP